MSTFLRELPAAPRSATEVEVANIIIKDPNILGGEPVFRGTRLPFKALIDYFAGGATLDQFLKQYPRVSRELAIAAAEFSHKHRLKIKETGTNAFRK
jgi:uncharacterized protein (DUF433 family)